ncbi:LysM peptidoglycan-binding domain-containing protein [Halpernia frigidisoli]|uniref:ABC-type branched-chain amino acid transport system, substrate-binding protein n=1 Tax=Halpernia frigidisoli TaxID=1125876 RepID=A0A1I3GK97_9FLAO|nr:LysM peptidoglycan-binding domain-containing protein [Halpernia frigidisoli]SFI23869.1 ABC-type branched-chain amino acid transport system, substrate-binding protein [Halpernia frigidisoli]
MIKQFLFLSGLLVSFGVFAQKTHVVIKGDNPYNISKKYGITIDQLYKLNLQAKGTLALGDVLKIDANTTKTAVISPSVSSKSTGKIVLLPKQTVYGITKQYHISEADLRNLNPNLDANMKIGDEVILPSNLISKYAGSQPLASAQTNVVNPQENVAETPKVTSENSYTVEAKDNYYRITRKFNLTQNELFALNPQLEQSGLKPGNVIIIKGAGQEISDKESKNTQKAAKVEVESSASSVNTRVSSSDDFVTYTVLKDDTVFGILNKFGISLDELISLNPELSQGLKSGMVLKIKKLEPGYEKKAGDALNVVLMLPFGFDSNDSKYRSLSFDFLTGAKLAIERNVKAGQKLDIKVIDAGNEKSFKNSLTQINPDNTDLIIGPFFKSSVLEVLDFVKKQNIPVVAPFANSADLYDYSNLVIIETNDNVYADRIAKEVKDVFSDQKIYIVADQDKIQANYIKNNLEKNLKTPNIVIVNSSSEISVDKNMMTGQSAPVIAILATDDESTGAAFAQKMIEISKLASGTKSFSMYYNSAFEKNVDDLSEANLVYLMDRKIVTDGTFEKEVLADYKLKYCKSPSKYSVIGFDVVNDILSRENKKGELFKQMGKVQTQLATKFEFVRTKPNGAYQNTGYRVVRLMPQN